MRDYVLPFSLLLFACGKDSNPAPARVTDGTAQVETSSLAVTGASPPLAPVARSAMTARPVPSARTTDADRATVSRGNEAFALHLYAKLRAREGNLFFSPTSIRIALGMAYAGARGNTAVEMKKVLALGGSESSIHAGFAALLQDFEDAKPRKSLQDATDFQQSEIEQRRQVVHVRTQLWAQQGRSFTPRFLALLESHYAAPLLEKDFLHAPDDARAAINALVYEQTGETVRDLLPAGALTMDTKLALTNVASFTGQWPKRFEERLTVQGRFRVSPSSTVPAELMSMNSYVGYAKIGDVQLIKIRYALPSSVDREDWVSEDVDMVIALPDDAAGLSNLEDSMQDTTIGTWMAALSRPDPIAAQHAFQLPLFEYAHVVLPRFRMTSDFELSKTLSELGMRDVFDAGRADLSGMDGTKELSLGAVAHEALIAVDEKGTGAAVAVPEIGTVGGAPPPVRIEFRADHPFLFFLRDRRSSAVLFMGRVVNPSG